MSCIFDGFFDSGLSFWVASDFFGHEDRFEKVTVQKKSCNTVRVETFNDLHDKNTGNLLIADSTALVTQKLAMLSIVGIPLCLAGHVITHILKVPYDILRISLTGFTAIGVSLSQGNFSGAGSKLFSTAVNLGKELGQDVIEVVTSPYYALGMEIAAIKGFVGAVLFDGEYALEAKTIVGEIESQWKGRLPISRDIRYTNIHHDWSRVSTLFVAICFQPQGNMHDTLENGDPKYTITRARPLDLREKNLSLCPQFA